MPNDQSILDVAKSTGLPIFDTEKAIGDITKGILLKTFRKSPKDARDHRINDRVRKAFATLYPNGKWSDDFGDVAAIGAMGPPGQGKTTSFEKAAERAAMAMGMKFVDRKELTPDYVVDTENDFVFVTQEFSGENSKHGISGIPSKKEGKVAANGELAVYMDYLRDRRFELLAKAPAGLFLLDDFPNAQPAIQNIGLSLIEEGRYQGLSLPHVYIAPTGNLGALDGTYTSAFGTAITNRLRLIFVVDTLDNFRVRVQQGYRGENADMLVSAFLEVNKSHFAQFPDANNRGKPFPSPRTWIKLINTLAQEAMFEGAPERVASRVQDMSASLVGQDAAMQFSAYFHAAMAGAVPLARELINTGKLDEEMFKKHSGSQNSAQGFSFSYQFAVSVAEYAVAFIARSNVSKDGSKEGKKKNEEELDRVMAAMTYGLNKVDESNMDLSFTLFKDRLANQVDSMAIPVADQSKGQGAGQRALRIDVLQDINKAVLKSPAGQRMDNTRLESLWAALSGSRKTNSAENLKASRGKKLVDHFN